MTPITFELDAPHGFAKLYLANLGMKPLAGKVAIINSSSSGIEKAIAVQFVKIEPVDVVDFPA